jgi:hypothetical protein
MRRMIIQSIATFKRMLACSLLAAIPMMLLFTTGCGSKPQDVTNDPAFGNFASVVGPWKTKVPLRLVETEKELYLVYGDQALSGRDLLLIPAGTEIRIEHLIFRSTFETDFLDMWGSLVVGPYSGKSVHIDSRLFTSVDSPGGYKETPTQYYKTYHHPSYPKPDWIATPDKLVR